MSAGAANDGGEIGTSRVRWADAVRLVPTRFPPIQLFERVADPADLDAVLALESMTNPRLRDAVGDLALVPPGERVSGPGSSPLMAAFTHVNPDGSRFADGRFGVYYAARELETAVAETRFHRERFLAATAEPSLEIAMRVYVATIDARFHDLRGRRDDYPDVHDPDPARYGAAQALARTLRERGSNGIAYDSVRREGGQCIAVFRPRAVRVPVRERDTLRYVWDGERRRITDVFEVRAMPGARR